MPTADLYTSFEPAGVSNVAAETVQVPDALHHVKMKRAIDTVLKERGIKFYLLVDKVDEFVIREEYDAKISAPRTSRM